MRTRRLRLARFVAEVWALTPPGFDFWSSLGLRRGAQYASMQGPAMRDATERALRATPEEMGRAAVEAARRGR
jgi:hypothetical protein